MKRSMTLAVAGALLATLLSTTVAAAAAPSNDLPAGAIGLTDTLPQTINADTSEATVTTDDFGCGAGGLDQASVWYSITPTDGVDVLIDPTASSYLVGVNVYITSAGQENLITCFQGPSLVTLQAGATYYLMFADTDLDATNGGALSVTLDVPPPPIEMSVTLDPTGSVDKAGNVTIRGSITCSQQASFADLSAFLRQAVGRFTFTGNASASPDCGPTPSSWTLSASGQNGRFGGGKIQVEIMAFACSPTSCVDTGIAGTVRLGR
jgi:hypothetical protein